MQLQDVEKLESPPHRRGVHEENVEWERRLMSNQEPHENHEKKLIRNSTAEFLIFTGQAGEQSIEARYEDETIWLTQKLMAELFAVDVRTVSEHLKNIFQGSELLEDSVIRKFRNTATDGKSYLIQFYNLDAIISVGYRVNSVRATQFRQWATQVLREFAIKGYVLNKKRMVNERPAILAYADLLNIAEGHNVF